MKKTLTDNDIIACADRLNWEKGFEKMRIIDIARELGVSHTAIYKHFESKDAIFDILLRDRYDQTLHLAEKSGNPMDDVRNFLRLLHFVNARENEKNPEHFASCAQYFKANLQMNLRYNRIIGDYMVRETGISFELALAILTMTQHLHSPMFVEIWSAQDFEQEFAICWTVLAESILTPMLDQVQIQQ